MIFDFNDITRVTYLNNKDPSKSWKAWKTWKELTNEEKNEINLASYPTNCILFDKDYRDDNKNPTLTQDQILEEVAKFKEKLHQKNIFNYVIWLSPAGFHVLAPFENFESFGNDLKKEIKKIYIKEFECDLAKVSDLGVVSLPDKPHFKNGIVYPVYEEKTLESGVNKFSKALINIAQQNVIDKMQQYENQRVAVEASMEFANFFESDPFWKYLNNTEGVIPLGTQRNNVIFPNLAIACAKSGKSEQEIRDIITDFLKRKMPDIPYGVFNGWLQKAFKGEISTYNVLQLNKWMKEFRQEKPLYEIKMVEETADDIKIAEASHEEANLFSFVLDKDLKDVANHQTEWLVENWLPKGDISFVVGKAASFKTTVVLHIVYCIANGLPIFGKYATIKSNVLYLNEENNNNLFISLIKRIKKGLGLGETTDCNIAFGLLQGIKLDNVEHVKHLANYMIKNHYNVLVLDSFRRFIGFDENNATEMAKLFSFLIKLRSLCNLTIIGLHHLKKDNSNFKSDMRDMLRGSSDMVNSADSIISIERGHKNNFVKMGHIKNRAGEELANKKIELICGSDNDMWKFEEAKDIEVLQRARSKVDEAAEAIVKHLEDNKVKSFARKDINEKIEYSPDTVTKALRQLVEEGSLQTIGEGKRLTYSFI